MVDIEKRRQEHYDRLDQQAKDNAEREAKRLANEARQLARQQRDILGAIADDTLAHASQLDRDIAAAKKKANERLATLAEAGMATSNNIAMVQSNRARDIARAYEEAEQRQAEAIERALRESTYWRDGVIRASRDITASAADQASQMESLYTNTTTAIEDAFVKLATTGKLTFHDLTNSIIADLVRIQVRQAITTPLNNALAPIFANMGGALFGAPDYTKVAPPMRPVPVAHRGGIAGQIAASRVVDMAAFRNAHRMHTGGLVPGEVPTILQRGEGVFTPAQMRALAPVNSQPVQVNVVVHNNAPADVQVEQDRDVDGNLTLRVLVDAVTEQQAQDIAKGEGLSPVIERNFGVKKTGS